MSEKLFSNGNLWPSIITILLTVNLAGIGILVSKISSIDQKLEMVNERSLNSARDLIYLENRMRNLPNEYARREWVLNYFVPKRRDEM